MVKEGGGKEGNSDGQRKVESKRKQKRRDSCAVRKRDPCDFETEAALCVFG